MEIEIASKYLPLFETNKHYAICRSGRIAGKSVHAAEKSIINAMAYPERDQVICRCNYSDLKDSLYSEILAQISALNLNDSFLAYQAPLRIVNKVNSNIIYFEGIGGSDTSRTRSFKPAHKLSLIVIEEAQQLARQESLEQALASFRRHLDTDNGMILILFNPEPVSSHWLNVFYNLKKSDDDWICVEASYMDILDYINDLDLREIIKMKVLDLPRYKWMYLGETTGGYGSVYIEFNREKHLLTPQQATDKFGSRNIVGCIIGVDSAVTHDKTAYVPIMLLDNGQAITRGKDIFYHDPLKWGDYGSVQLMPTIKKWYSALNNHYGLDANKIPTFMVVDSASTELIKILRYEMPINVYSFSKPSIVAMVDNVKGVLSRNMWYLIDDGYHQTIKGALKRDNILAEEIESLKWKDKSDGSTPTTYDSQIPNDVCDAWTYGINTWFKNPNNLNWLQIANMNRREFYDL